MWCAVELSMTTNVERIDAPTLNRMVCYNRASSQSDSAGSVMHSIGLLPSFGVTRLTDGMHLSIWQL